MQLGFVIDHSRCIGCHACTVACKSENDVPLGSFRTWVKYTEEGQFPEVRRSFAVLRCNQCTDAPCVSICPTSALEKLANGIVDINPKACIGCKSCMHGCPYDALHINPQKGTAEKCHFCAHRVDQGLAPACAVVCPTEAIIPGDFDDPDSRVSRMKAEHSLSARKTEAGTGPNVLYRDVTPAGIDPGLTNISSGYIWSQNPTGPRMDAQVFEAMESQARARTTYDVPRDILWGWKITAYLFSKSLAAGILPAAYIALGATQAGTRPGMLAPLLSLLFLSLTGLALVIDLKRPERFWMILVRPNWNSWLARGTYVIVAYSLALVAWILVGWLGHSSSGALAGAGMLVTIALAGMTAAYTAFLFGQAKGRVLWMKRGYWLQLLAQALVAGSGLLLVLATALGWNEGVTARLSAMLAIGLLVSLAFALLEERLAPRHREREYLRAARLVTKGPYARTHHLLGMGVGIALPLGLLAIGLATGGFVLPAMAGAAALVGLWFTEDVFVRAGQSLPIS